MVKNKYFQTKLNLTINLLFDIILNFICNKNINEFLLIIQNCKQYNSNYRSKSMVKNSLNWRIFILAIFGPI